jgi:hypothetical protein
MQDQYNNDGARRQPENSLAERFTCLLRHPRQRLSAKVDDRWIEVSPKQLLDYRQFRAAALGQEGIFLPPCPQGQWERIVEERVESSVEWRS